MKIFKTIIAASLILATLSTATSCKKNENEAEGTYYNERNGETGSTDTTAVTNRTEIDTMPLEDTTGMVKGK